MSKMCDFSAFLITAMIWYLSDEFLDGDQITCFKISRWVGVEVAAKKMGKATWTLQYCPHGHTHEPNHLSETNIVYYWKYLLFCTELKNLKNLDQVLGHLQNHQHQLLSFISNSTFTQLCFQEIWVPAPELHCWTSWVQIAALSFN